LGCVRQQKDEKNEKFPRKEIPGGMKPGIFSHNYARHTDLGKKSGRRCVHLYAAQIQKGICFRFVEKRYIFGSI
jgi:hypothetical protein